MGIIKLKKTNEEAKAAEELESGTVAEEVISAEKAATDENVLPREALFENKDKKSMHQDIFRFNDGTIRQFVSGEPKNYVDKATKKHKKIQTCLCKNSEGDLECRKNIFETRFYAGVENGRIYSMKKDNCEVTLTADIKKVGSAVEQPNDEGSNKAVLKDVRSGVDIEYEVEPNRIKENIIVKERQENYIFDFGINLTNLDISVAEDYKALELKDKDTGATVFRIPSPVMYDANGEYSDEVSYEISKNDETLSVKVVAEPEYFNAPERAFPVVIDPQVTVATDEVTSYKVYRKMRGSSGYTYNWNETTSQYIKVSRDSAYDYKTVIKIDKSKIGLLDSTINSVKLRLRKYSISQYGNILVNGSSVYMGSGDIIGYRADDSYFSFARDFVKNTITVLQLSRAMELGKLGIQVVLHSEKSFEQLTYIKSTIAENETYYTKRVARDLQARQEYQDTTRNIKVDKEDLFIMDIIRQEVKNDDPRIQRNIFR